MKPNEHIAPFLAQPIDLKVGLNHLGYRNAAEDLFTTLLPGLNNVTARIRYYSFYCWLLDKFFEGREEPTIREYQRFVRSSEYLLAILHADMEDAGGIPGIDYALNIMQKKPDVVDLQTGVFNSEGATRGTYWANKGGVLVQYYGNSLRDIGITVPNIKHPELNDISKEGPNITGKALASAFEKSVGLEASALFLACVQNGRVSRGEMNILRTPFLMKNFIANDQERKLLIELLLQEDYPGRSERTYRKDTIRLFLEYYSDGTHNYKDALGFPQFLYGRYLEGKDVSSCIMGWYCFYLDDLWQYNASIILERILDILQKEKAGKWVHLDVLTTDIADEVASRFAADNKCLSEVMENLTSPKGKDNIGRIGSAIYQILYYHDVNAYVWPKTGDLAKKFGYFDTNDFYAASIFIDKHRNMPFKEFVKYFIESKIIYRHYNVSLKKFYQTGITSHKFMLENGYIRYLKDTFTTVTHTSPRLETLKGFMSDLGLIKGNEITPEGKDTLTLLQQWK